MRRLNIFELENAGQESTNEFDRGNACTRPEPDLKEVVERRIVRISPSRPQPGDKLFAHLSQRPHVANVGLDFAYTSPAIAVAVF